MLHKLALLTCLASSAFATDAITNATSGPWTAELNGIWRWHAGDDLNWASASFDDSTWKRVTIPGPPPYEFRYWIRIPLLLDKVSDPGLMVGPIAYAYEVFWDGQRIGGLGEGPPHSAWFAVRPMVFQVPGFLAVPSRHVIAIRVWDSRQRIDMRPAQISALENRVGSLSALKDIEVALWSRRMRSVSLGLVIDCVLVLTGLYFIFLPRSIAQGLAIRWFGACLLSRGLYVLCLFYEHFGPPVISAGISEPVVRTLFGLNFIFLVDFAYAMFHRRVPIPVRLIQALNVLAILAVEISPISLFPELSAVAGTTAVVISIIGAALAAIEFRKSSPGAGVTLALFMVWACVTTAYLLNNVFRLTVPVFIEVSGSGIRMVLTREAGFLLPLWETSLFLWVPVIAVEIHRINEGTRAERERLRLEMEAARHVQQLLVQSQSVQVPGFEIDATYQPATEVGGDFFQLFPASNDSLLVVIGDVSGKGMKAALLVSLIVGALQNRKSDAPGSLLRELNAVLLGRSEGGFTTCCCGLFAQDGTLALASAGHLAPYRNGREIASAPGFPLGIDAGARWIEQRIELEPGDRLLWISDGVVEARNGKHDLLGFERAQELATRSASEIAQVAQQFGQEDDITVVSITRQTVPAYVA